MPQKCRLVIGIGIEGLWKEYIESLFDNEDYEVKKKNKKTRCYSGRIRGIETRIDHSKCLSKIWVRSQEDSSRVVPIILGGVEDYLKKAA